jgi:hypothetical protein
MFGTTMPYGGYGTTTMAAPRAAYAAPVTTAAPVAYAQQATYAPPMTTAVAAPSYVAPPVMPAMQYAAPQAMQYAAPQIAPPQSLTQGIPTPQQIADQKAKFGAALDKQLQDAISTIQNETKIEKQMVQFTAEKQISMYNMQVDEKLTEAIALADEQCTIGTLELNKAKVERGLQLNAQAQGLVFDYTMRATQQELATKQYQFEQQYMNAENKLAQDYAKTLGAAGPAAQGGVGYGGYAAPVTQYAAPATTAYAAPRAPAYAAPATTAYGAYPGAVY